MGAGAALGLIKHFPAAQYLFGNFIQEKYKIIDSVNRVFEDYHLLTITGDSLRPTTIGAIQTKREWWKSSPVNLVKKSLEKLTKKALAESETEFHCVMPGVGNGGLLVEEVKPYTDLCPDNVTFWWRK